MQGRGFVMNDTAYCPHCDAKTEYRIWSGYVHAVIQDRHIGYYELTALCEKCGNEVSVKWVDEENKKRRDSAYAGR